MAARVLILTASVGEGHDLPARTLAEQLRTESPAVEIVTEDALAAMGRVPTTFMESAPRVVFYRQQWVYDLGFWLISRFPPSRSLIKQLVSRVGAPGLLRLIRAASPDVVVSTYPAATEVLGWLRRRGQLGVPVCAAITDLAGMHYWAAPGVDLHLVTHPESILEVREVAGDGGEVRCVHGLTAAAFGEARSQRDARSELGLPLEGRIVLVSGGGWGVGDLQGAAETALDEPGVAEVVCLCGRNDELLARMRRRYAADDRFRAEGFTDRMSDWLAAADVLVHSTGGLTVLEAQLRGCRPISYGWGRGHIRLHNQAFRRFGLAEVAGSRAELARVLREALAAPRATVPPLDQLPSAASLVLELASDRVRAAA